LIAPASQNNNEREDDSSQVELEAVLQKLTLYEYKERLVLLALAVWKAQCIASMPAMTGTIAYFVAAERMQHWATVGWKTVKAEHRDANNAMNIIVKAVRPFLPN
jgi:hypothetical protein